MPCSVTVYFDAMRVTVVVKVCGKEDKGDWLLNNL